MNTIGKTKTVGTIPNGLYLCNDGSKSHRRHQENTHLADKVFDHDKPV